jgi:hypothetical protein
MLGTYDMNINYTYAFDLQKSTPYCPKAYRAPEQDCSPESIYRKVELKDDDELRFEINAATGPDSPSPFIYKYNKAIDNVLQVFHSAVRLDIGLDLPNNVLTNSSMLNVSISDLIEPKNEPQTKLYQRLITGNLSYPIAHVDRSTINTSFTCAFKFIKPWPELLVTVLVATSSMFTTGWAIIMAVAGYFVKDQDGLYVLVNLGSF